MTNGTVNQTAPFQNESQEDGEQRWGECRINPPEVLESQRGIMMGAWPLTEAGHWCGKGVGILDRFVMPAGVTFGEWVEGGQFVYLRVEGKGAECQCANCIFWHETKEGAAK